MEIEYECQQQHGRGLIPEGVLRLTAFRCGVFEEVGDESLNVVIVSQIHERVIAVASFHVDQIKDLDVITFFLK